MQRMTGSDGGAAGQAKRNDCVAFGMTSPSSFPCIREGYFVAMRVGCDDYRETCCESPSRLPPHSHLLVYLTKPRTNRQLYHLFTRSF